MSQKKVIVFIAIGLCLVSCNTKTVDYVEPSLSPTPKPETQQVKPTQTPTANSATQQFWQTMDAYRAFDETLFANATGTAESAISTHMNRVHQRQTQSATPSIAVTPSPTITPRAPDADFKVIYREKDFVIRERYLGKGYDYRKLDRIEVYWPELGFSGYTGFLKIIKPYESANWYTQSLQIMSTEGQLITFELDLIELPDTYIKYFRFKKNGKIVAGGSLYGGACSSILDSRRIGNEFAIEYNFFDFVSRENQTGGYGIHSIIITNGDSAIDIVKTTGYSEAFAPYNIQRRFLYFAEDEFGKEFIVYDGNEVGNRYDTILNQCMYEGPRIRGNKQVVDFVARRDGASYHVQAGDPDYFEGDG